MNRILLSLLLLVGASAMVTAQSSLSIVYLERDVWGNTDANYIQAGGTVENTSSQVVEAKVRMIELDLVPGTLNYFCWAQCYEPGVLISPSSITLDPGERMDQFYGDYVPQGQSGTTEVKYCFFNVANESDSVCAHVRFSASPVGLEDILSSGRPGISEAFPNPAVRDLTINYVTGNTVGQIDVFSMLGTKVKSIKLPQLVGKVKINVENLPAGMYLYKLSTNGKDIQTRKFLVTK